MFCVPHSMIMRVCRKGLRMAVCFVLGYTSATSKMLPWHLLLFRVFNVEQPQLLVRILSRLYDTLM